MLFMGCEAKQLSRGGEGSEAQMEAPSFIDEVLPHHKHFLLVAPDGSVWLLKINHPPGRGAGERGEEVEMVEEEDSFAVPALQHHGDAGKGPLPQGGKGQLPPQHPCWTSSWLLLHLAGSKLAPSQVMNRR